VGHAAGAAGIRKPAELAAAELIAPATGDALLQETGRTQLQTIAITAAWLAEPSAQRADALVTPRPRNAEIVRRAADIVERAADDALALDA
jgi:hypothetical protein